MGRFKAVIFDLDDTLYPERQFVRGGFEAAARWVSSQSDCSSERCAEELVTLFDRGERKRTFDVWLESAGLPVTLSSGMVEAYRQHRPCLTLHDDAGASIEHCLQSRVATGLVSDGFLDVQRRKVTSLGLATMLKTIVLSDEFGRAFWKPSTKPYLVAVERLGVLPGEAVYVGDNPRKDFKGARASGLKSVRIRRPDGIYASEEAEDRGAEPDCELTTLAKLHEALAVL
jgi:putative hydrolase of the HAD superfamily